MPYVPHLKNRLVDGEARLLDRVDPVVERAGVVLADGRDPLLLGLRQVVTLTLGLLLAQLLEFRLPLS